MFQETFVYLKHEVINANKSKRITFVCVNSNFVLCSNVTRHCCKLAANRQPVWTLFPKNPPDDCASRFRTCQRNGPEIKLRSLAKSQLTMKRIKQMFIVYPM